MITVCGPHEANDEEIRLAEAVGEALSLAGETLVCGGRGGVMEATCRGAKRGGGTTIGILPGNDVAEANQWVDYAIPTGLGEARNALVVASGAAVIAVGGGFGTLSEIALALKRGKTVVALKSWTLEIDRLARFGGSGRYLMAADAGEAVTLALEAAARAARLPGGSRRIEAPPSSHG